MAILGGCSIRRAEGEFDKYPEWYVSDKWYLYAHIALLMIYRSLLIVLFSLYSAAVYAQPVWSPQKRSEMEMEWMRDSLHLTSAQVQKASPASLNYQLQIDESHGSAKKEHAAMKKKDAAMKAILSASQYKKYYRREKQIRALPKRKETGRHQAY